MALSWSRTSENLKTKDDVEIISSPMQMIFYIQLQMMYGSHFHEAKLFFKKLKKSLWPSEAILGPSLGEMSHNLVSAMACCLLGANHYLN